MQAVHLPFAVETMGGLSDTALQLLREIHHSAVGESSQLPCVGL